MTPGKVHSGFQKKWFLKCAAFQFLELLQVAFLELLQDLTKVYSVGANKRLTFCFVGVTHGDGLRKACCVGSHKDENVIQ